MNTKSSILQTIQEYLGEMPGGSPPAPFLVMARVLATLYPARVPHGADDDLSLLRSLTTDLLKPPARIERVIADDEALASRFSLDPAGAEEVRDVVGRFLRWHCRQTRSANARNVRLLDGWTTLLAQVKEVTGPGRPIGSRPRLGKLAAFCTLNGIDAGALTESHTEGFWRWLYREGAIKRPRQYYTEIRRVWGVLAGLNLVSPVDFAELPRQHGLYGLAVEDMPEYWRDICSDLVKRMRSGKPADAHLHLSKPAAESSVGVLRRLLGFVQHEIGADLQALDLAGLFGRTEFVEGLLKFLQGRKGRFGRHHVDQLEQLHRIAQRYGVDTLGLDFDAGWMIEVRRKLRPGTRRDTMEAPPSAEDLQATIAGLSEDIRRGATHGWTAGTMLAKKRDHFMLMFYVHCGNRRGDLVRARVDRHLVKKRGTTHLVISTKNSTRDSVPLTPAVCRSLEAYMAQRQAMGIDHEALLVTRTGKALNQVQVYQQIAGCFQTHVGRKFSVHAIRHAFAVNDVVRHGDVHKTSARMGIQSKTVSGYYDRVKPAQYCGEWHDILEAARDGKMRVLQWGQRLIDRCAEDPVLREMVSAALRGRSVAEEVLA